jgi:hypothetical protein
LIGDTQREDDFDIPKLTPDDSFNPSISPTIRPRRCPPRTRTTQSSHIKIMSLVALKTLFYGKTITPIPRPKPSHPSWSNASEPLLPAPSTKPTSSHASDLEAQTLLIPNPEKPHTKRGFRVDARVISDATIGLSDGLTVPFALTAGLSALGNTKFVIYGGFAELIAGAISMGVGGYLGAKSEQYVSP